MNRCDLYSPACLNGATCVDSPSSDSYSCICPPAYTGYRCETNFCATNPCINGVCSTTATGYKCTCNRGFTSQNCEIAINLCSASVCQNNGLCLQNTLNQSVSCLCMAGYTGATCENFVDNCFGQPCSNGATCIPTASSFICQCSLGYTGNLCQFRKFACDSNPCLNEGVCHLLSANDPTQYGCYCKSNIYLWHFYVAFFI